MSNKIVLITGASSGIGKATAELLAKSGHIVYAAARRLDKMEDMKKLGVKPIKMDITNHEEVANAVEIVIQNEGRIDVLFNNAGYGLYGAVEEIPVDDARYQFEVNIFGLADITKLVVPHMRKQKSGTIINTSSMGGKVYTPMGAWYHATKHALEGWSDCLRLELSQFGIDVVIVEPGIIETEFSDVVGERALKYSGIKEYANIKESVAKATTEIYKKGNGSPASDIAQVVLKAINTRKPKTRYVKGKLARPFILLRKLVSDKIFDKLVMNQVTSRN